MNFCADERNIQDNAKSKLRQSGEYYFVPVS